jgi:hypothetical protein
MRKLDEFLEELSVKLHEAAENLTSEIDYEGLNTHKLTVEVEGEYFEFMVEAFMKDYKYEEETNSSDYKATVFCKGIPEHHNEKVVEYMKIEFLNEILYKD